MSKILITIELVEESSDQTDKLQQLDKERREANTKYFEAKALSEAEQNVFNDSMLIVKRELLKIATLKFNRYKSELKQKGVI